MTRDLSGVGRRGAWPGLPPPLALLVLSLWLGPVSGCAPTLEEEGFPGLEAPQGQSSAVVCRNVCDVYGNCYADCSQATADASTPPFDAGTPDAGRDAGAPDAGRDAGTPDAGTDAGTPDAGPCRYECTYFPFPSCTYVCPGDGGTPDAGDAGPDAGPDAGEDGGCPNVCPNGLPIQECDDGNPCTEDSFSCENGCEFTPVADGTACNDEDVCTTGDSCQAGSCTAAGPLQCDDGNECTDDECMPGYGCANVNNESSCDDSDPYTVNDRCENGGCAGSFVTCNGEECSACSLETYDLGSQQCVAVEPACKEGDPNCSLHMSASCAEDACGGSSCDDSCHMYQGQCRCEPPPPTCETPGCDDGNACTQDSCTQRGCWNELIDAQVACDDGNACTVESCDPAEGCSHTAVSCDDGNPCTIDACDSETGGCSHTFDTGAACPPPSACYTGGTCDPVYGCLYDRAPNGTSCDDGNACTTGDTCDTDGVCQGTPSTSCQQVACEVWNEWLGNDGQLRTGAWYQTGKIVSLDTGEFWEGYNESGEPATNFQPTPGCEMGLVVDGSFVRPGRHRYADTGQPVMLAMGGPGQGAKKPAAPPAAAAAAVAPRPLAAITEMPANQMMKTKTGYGFTIERYGTQAPKLSGSGFQSEHVLQDAAYGAKHGGRIPRNDSPCIAVYGRASQNVADAAFAGHSATDANANISAHFIKHRTFESGHQVGGKDLCVGFWEFRTGGRRNAGQSVLAEDVGKVVAGKRLGTDTGGVYPPGHKPTHAEYIQQLRTAIRRMNGNSPAAEKYVTQVNKTAVDTILQYWPELVPKGPDGKPVRTWMEDGTLNPAIQKVLEQTYIPNLPENAVGGHPRE